MPLEISSKLVNVRAAAGVVRRRLVRHPARDTHDTHARTRTHMITCNQPMLNAQQTLRPVAMCGDVNHAFMRVCVCVCVCLWCARAAYLYRSHVSRLPSISSHTLLLTRQEAPRQIRACTTEPPVNNTHDAHTYTHARSGLLHVV